MECKEEEGSEEEERELIFGEKKEKLESKERKERRSS